MAVVYKISCKENDKVYIGSTSRPLKQRLAEHKCKKLGSIKKLFEDPSVTVAIEEVATYDGEDKMGLRLLEKDILKQHPTAVNKACPIVVDLREKYDRKNEGRRHRIQCCHCEASFSKNNMRQHIKLKHKEVELQKKLNFNL